MHLIKGEVSVEKPFAIAIVVSRFNEPVTSKLLEGALHRLESLGFTDEHITVAEVPGAVEIPIAAQRFAQTGDYKAVIALGAVIRGETPHFDYVSEQVSQGCQQVSLQHNLPVIFGVLTTENGEQALERVGGSKGHKGIYAVDAAIEMVDVCQQITPKSRKIGFAN